MTLKKSKAKRGRPKKANAEKRTCRIAVNFTPGEMFHLEHKARKDNLSPSAAVRAAFLQDE